MTVLYTACMSNATESDHFALVPSVYLLLRRDSKVLLLRRANTGYMDGNYSLVAGHVEADEPASASAVREAKEEAGITIKPDSLHLVFMGHRYNRGRIDFVFAADNWQGEITNMEPERCDDLSWHALDKLPINTIPYVRFVLENIAKGASYAEYFEEV